VEGRVVAEVEVDVPVQRTVRVQHRPASAARGRGVVVPLPREFHFWPVVARRVPAVELAVNRDEAELAESVVAELDEAGLDQVDGVLIA
jgi:hypothetical protein